MAFITIPLQVVKWVFKLGKEENRRFIAEVIDFPGVLAYGNTKQEAVAKVQALALRVLADKLEHGEVKHTYKIFEEIKDREAYYQNMMWVFDLQKKYDKQQLKFFKMREKKIFKYSPLEDYDMEEYNTLLEKNSNGTLTESERLNLISLRYQADLFMLRKAQSAVLLRWRGYSLPNL